MDLKRLVNLENDRKVLKNDIASLDNIIILDLESVNIFKGNGISIEDLSELLNIKTYSTQLDSHYWDDGGMISADPKSIDHILKILSISKNDLAYIISKTRIFKKIFNITAQCYFTALLTRLENSLDIYANKEVYYKETVLKEYESVRGYLEEDEKNELSLKLQKAINVLRQILSMVNDNITIDVSTLNGGESTIENGNRNIIFNDSGTIIIIDNYLLRDVIAGNSDIAIKLYEDLLVGYKKNNKAALYYSQLFTKYIVS